MHICFLTNEYPKEGFPHGGIGSFTKTLAVALIDKGIRVSVIGLNYTSNNETEIVYGVHVHRLKRSTIKMISWHFNFKAINNKIKEIHREHPINIIETSELGLAFISKIKNIKYIIRLHGGHHFFAEGENRGISKWKGFQEKKSFKNSDGFIAVSRYVKNHTEKYLSYYDKPLGYINNPINSKLFKPTEKYLAKAKIVFVGTVCEKKGIRQLIQAFPFVKDIYPEAILEIYGRDWFFLDGSSYIQLLKEKELPKLGEISKDIHFYGAVSQTQLPEIYEKASICVFPSHIETQGLVAPEAMAMERPVIFTKLGPGPETIEDYKTGLLCDPYDPEDIAEKIIWVFSNQNKAKEIGEKAREFVLKKYGLSPVVSQNICFYQSVINE